ncbi:MAG TPA: hypothetical protein VN688_20470 [Gemmataceae bacterium]|nr:hypothetical protein [Gemmataceae bacterium]
MIHVHEEGPLAIVTDGGERVAIDRETAPHVYTAWEWWLAAGEGSSVEAHRWNLVLEAAQDHLNAEGRQDSDAMDVERGVTVEDFTQTEAKTLQLIADLDGDTRRRELAREEIDRRAGR